MIHHSKRNRLEAAPTRPNRFCVTLKSRARVLRVDAADATIERLGRELASRKKAEADLKRSLTLLQRDHADAIALIESLTEERNRLQSEFRDTPALTWQRVEVQEFSEEGCLARASAALSDAGVTVMDRNGSVVSGYKTGMTAAVQCPKRGVGLAIVAVAGRRGTTDACDVLAERIMRQLSTR